MWLLKLEKLNSGGCICIWDSDLEGTSGVEMVPTCQHGQQVGL
jgi:hypothetical protein